MYIYMYMCTCTVCQWQHLTGHRGAHISAQEGKRCMHTEHCTHVQCILNDPQVFKVSKFLLHLFTCMGVLLHYGDTYIYMYIYGGEPPPHICTCTCTCTYTCTCICICICTCIHVHVHVYVYINMLYIMKNAYKLNCEEPTIELRASDLSCQCSTT